MSYREAEAPTEPQRVTLDAPVTSVTVLEDRAVVTRKVELVLSSPQLVLTLVGLSPVVVDKTLTVTAEGPVDVVDVGVKREPVVDPRDVPVELRELDDRIETLRQRVDEQRALVDRLSKRVVQLRAVLASYLHEVVVDCAAGHEPSDVEAELRAVTDALRDTVRRAHEASSLATRSIDALRVEEQLRGERDRPTARQSARIQVVVTTRAALPVTATLTVRVTVGNACWRPRHRAELRCDDANPLVIHAMGTVWQNTGEDWSQIELVCSTERASLGTREPELSADVLVVTRRAPLVVETRQEAITELGAEPRRAAPTGRPGSTTAAPRRAWSRRASWTSRRTVVHTTSSSSPSRPTSAKTWCCSPSSASRRRVVSRWRTKRPAPCWPVRSNSCRGRVGRYDHDRLRRAGGALQDRLRSTPEPSAPS